MQLRDVAPMIALSVVGFVLFAYGTTPRPKSVAPDVQVTLVDGAEFSLRGSRGKTVVLNFWGSWCGPCKHEIPELSKFAEAHPEVKMVGLAVDSGDSSQVQTDAGRLGIRYPVGIASSALQSKYQVSALPTTVVIDKDGYVVYQRVGEITSSGLERAIKD